MRGEKGEDLGNYSLQIIVAAFRHLSSGGNGSRGRVDDLGGFIRLLGLVLLGFLGVRGSRISGRVLERSDRSWLFNLWGSLVDLGRGVDLLGFSLEKLVYTSRQTTSHPGRRPGGFRLLVILLLIFLVLVLLDLIRSGLRGGSLRLWRCGGLSLLDRLNYSGNRLGLRSGFVLRLGINGRRLIGRSGRFLGGRGRSLKLRNMVRFSAHIEG